MARYAGLIGAKNFIQDPRHAFERVEGKYEDQVYTQPAERRYPNAVTSAPDPNPFGNRR